MRRDNHAWICLLIVGLLLLASFTPGGAAQAGQQPCTEALQAEVDCCAASAPDASAPSCHIPCLCAPALTGERPVARAAEAARLPTPAAFGLAERVPRPDPLPPKPRHG